MKTVLAQELTAGMLIINLGIISSVELELTAKLIRVVIMEGNCLSAAFFWFRFDTPIKVI